MTNALKAGAVYFFIVFAVAFIMGTLRVLFVIPVIGETWAVMLEAPLILALSWFVCGWVFTRVSVAARLRPRLLMGFFAFALLMIAELVVSVLGFGRSVSEHFAAYQSFSAQLGLAAQVAFAAVPALRLRFVLSVKGARSST
jgi:ABC-type uncharacterized transport system permease subunit